MNKQFIGVRLEGLKLEAVQWVSRPVEEVFEFFSDPYNLEAITPDLLKFKVKKISTPSIQQGTRLDYQLKIHGFAIHWQSLIENWNPPFEFTDRQLKGPYQHWFHRHTFRQGGSGTWIFDVVEFRLPFSWLGSIMLKCWVAKDLVRIFTYRQQVIRDKFGDAVQL